MICDAATAMEVHTVKIAFDHFFRQYRQQGGMAKPSFRGREYQIACTPVPDKRQIPGKALFQIYLDGEGKERKGKHPSENILRYYQSV